jgi:hypothetical protein
VKGPLGAGAAGLVDDTSGAMEATQEVEKLLSTTKGKLKLITIIMIVWATIVTAALIIIVIFAFNRLRSRSEFMGESADSYVSDAESGHKADIASVINFDMGPHDGPVVTGEGREVEVNIDGGNGRQHDFEVEHVSAMFEEDDGTRAATASSGGDGRHQSRPNFRNAVTNSRMATSQFRGLYFPDSGASSF